jgi:hypothetical protein
VWSEFQGWAQKEMLSDNQSVWDWLSSGLAKTSKASYVGANEREDSLSGRERGKDCPDSRAIGQRASQFLRELRSEYTGAPFDQETQGSFGAEVSAAIAGTKPLFHEEWGVETAQTLAARLGPLMPNGVEVHAVDGHLYVYRPGEVRKIIGADASGYPGKNIQDKIHRSTLEGTNGLLLGYGARSMIEPGSVRVLIQDEHGAVVLGFNAAADQADAAGAARAADYARFTGRPFTYQVRDGAHCGIV